jgi:aminomuconate-semialdehyde/2-hydroxymuconate-6-semialdehyde dehydrogenase
MKRILNFIGGEYAEPKQKGYLVNYAPAKGAVYSEVANSGSQDLTAALKAAESAFTRWSTASIEFRSRSLIKMADLIESNLQELAEAESLDTGKPISLAREVDIPRAAANFRFFASAIVNFSTEAHLMEGLAVNYTRRSPIGIVGCISPWNLPLYLFTWKIAPALAMGNCVIGKPSEITPLTASMLGDIANQAGLPPGVLNILQGEGKTIGNAIV